MAIINGNGSNNLLVGTSLADTISGLGGEDVLIGSGGNDILDGGTGADTMDGGADGDTYIVDNVNDEVVEYANNGNDTVRSTIDFYLNNTPNVENLVLTGSADIDGFGNTLDNDIYGNSGDNYLWGSDGKDLLKGGSGKDTLNGGTGHDDMYGGIGDDYFVVDSLGDDVIEYAGQGLDTVASSVTYHLDANLENFILTGSSKIDAYGNELNNEITGNSGSNYIDGKGGADTMRGGGGNDAYVVDHEDDVVIEAADAGTDRVYSTVTFTLDANTENLRLEGTADVNGYGNDLDNDINGNSGNNILFGYGGLDFLDGGAGADTMYGGNGNDWYDVDNDDDLVIEFSGQGSDVVRTHGDMNYELSVNVENLYLDPMGHGNGTGNDMPNVIRGSIHDNTIDGGLGQDYMHGLAGDDIYYVDYEFDKVEEEANEGNDFVYSTANFTLPENVEILSLQIGNAVFATGNGAHNTLFGNANDNVLDGGGANDILSGLGGNDTFVFQAGQANGDVVYEFEGNGAGVGDVLKFVGYGPGATLNQMTATEWIVASADGTISEVFTLVGAPALNDLDYVFV